MIRRPLTQVKPADMITKEIFLKLAAEHGANRFLASDLWYFQPKDTFQLIDNFADMKASGWIGRNNGHAEALQRHDYMPGTGAGKRCERCDNYKRAPVHNTDPMDNPA